MLKSVHLGERQIRQPHKLATGFPSWYSTVMVRHTPDQLLQFLQVTDLEPHSRYEFTVRPMYHLSSAISGADQTEGVSVTVICQTDWKSKCAGDCQLLTPVSLTYWQSTMLSLSFIANLITTLCL